MSKTSDPTTVHVLSEQEIEAALRSPEDFATYLAYLSPEQVAKYKELLRDMEMEPRVKKAFAALLDLTEQEALKNAEEYRKHVLPEVENLSRCLELWRLIKELESLEKSL